MVMWGWGLRRTASLLSVLACWRAVTRDLMCAELMVWMVWMTLYGQAIIMQDVSSKGRRRRITRSDRTKPNAFSPPHSTVESIRWHATTSCYAKHKKYITVQRVLDQSDHSTIHLTCTFDLSSILHPSAPLPFSSSSSSFSHPHPLTPSSHPIPSHPTTDKVDTLRNPSTLNNIHTPTNPT